MQSFRCLTDDGRTFSECMSCYRKKQESIRKQQEADQEKKRKEEEESKKNPCAKKGCNNKTLHRFCSSCFRSQKDTEYTYMISRCLQCGCSFKGNSKFCSKECKHSYESC
jgi:response regulator of citrate/malate metabolism